MATIKKGIEVPINPRNQHSWLHPHLSELEPDSGYGLEINCKDTKEFESIKALIYSRNPHNKKCKFSIVSDKKNLTLWVSRVSVNGSENGKA